MTEIEEIMLKLAIIRKCLHFEIYEYIMKSDYICKVIREPYERKKKPNPKLIVFVEDEKTAKKIKDTCNAMIENANKLIRDNALKYELPYSEIKYKIKIINADSDILCTTSEASSRKRMTGREIKSKIRVAISEKDISVTTIDNHEELTDYEVLKLFSDDKEYTFSRETGSNYRATYFYNGCRHQISVGDILIAVGDKIEIKDSEPRKQRTDKKNFLFSLIFEKNKDTITIYVYP